MTINPVKLVGSEIEFAGFGKSSVAYIRRIEARDYCEQLGDTILDDEELELWGLFAADGEALAISDDQTAIIDTALERELLTVSRH